MQTKRMLFAACLLATAFLQASTTPHSTHCFSKPAQADVRCNVPAPNNFHLVEVGTNMAKVAWDFQSQALGGYRLRTYRSGDNVLVSTILRSQDELDATITGLTSGVEYYCIINSRCADGSDSDLQESAPIIVLILDLIVVGIQETSGESICPIWAQGSSCSFMPSGSPFDIKKDNGRSKRFVMSVESTGGQTRYRCTTSPDSPTNPYDFVCGEVFQAMEDCTSNFEISIWDAGEQVAKFTVSQTNTSNLRCTFLQPHYSIHKILPSNIGRPAGPVSGQAIGRGNIGETLVSIASATPNPFSDRLDIFPGNTVAEKITLQLYNLSGQKVLDQQFAGVRSSTPCLQRSSAPASICSASKPMAKYRP